MSRSESECKKRGERKSKLKKDCGLISKTLDTNSSFVIWA